MQRDADCTSTPRLCCTGLPMSSVSSNASSSLAARIFSAKRSSTRLRWAGALWAQRPSANAARAAPTAASMSAALPRATCVSTRPSSGEMQSKVWPEWAATRRPAMKARPSNCSAAARWRQSMVGVFMRGSCQSEARSDPVPLLQVGEREVQAFADQHRELVGLVAGHDEWRRDDHPVADRAHDQAVAEAMAAAQHAHRQARMEDLAARLVLDEMQRAHQAAGLRFADERVLGERVEVLGKVGADVIAHPLAEPLALDQAQVRERHRASHRVTALGVAMVELAALFDEHFGDALADHHAAERDIARADTLRKGHQVGLEAEGLAAEPLAGATEAGDDLVGDDEHAVFVADALDLGPVGGGRDDHAAGTLHRLADERGDLVGADLQDLQLEPARRLEPELVSTLSMPVLEPERLLDVDDARDRQAALFVHAAHAAERGAGHRRAVVGVGAADDDGALGLAGHVPVAARHPPDGGG